MTDQVTRRGLLGGAGATLLLASCGKESSSAPKEARPGGKLRLGIVDGERAGNLDAHKPLGLGSTIRGFAMYSKLWEWGEDMLPRLALAEFAEANATASAWDIRLKPGLEFHHGKTITADDVIFSIRRLTDPTLASPYSALVSPVDRDGVRKLDERTVRIPIKTGSGFVALPETWTNFGAIVPTDYHPVTNPVGAGPYKINDFQPGRSATFAKFANYFKPGKPYVDELEILEFKDHTARVAALLAGQIDLANGILPEHAALVRQDARASILVSKTNGWQSFDMNTKIGPFVDERVRRAFRLIADREELVRRALQGEGRIGNDLYAPQDPTFDKSIAQRVQDLDEARSLLRSAGHENLATELVVGPNYPAAAQVFAEQARKAGVTLKLRQVDAATFQGPARRSWAISTGGTLGVPWLASALHTDAPTSVANKTNFDDPKFAELFEAALSEPDLARRSALVHQAQAIQHERGGILLWGFTNTLDGIGPKVGGAKAEQTLFPTWRFENLWV
ncbi:MAG: ABC transporter substrate-binding protein [Novosphingobium sp.]